MDVTLENDKLKVVICSIGAEVQSIQYKGAELIWQADKSIWGRHAPLLFPIIGRLKNQQYTLDDKTFKISQHGFARDSQFLLAHSSATQAVFSLCSNPMTQKLYPFDFKLDIAYTLVDNKLVKTHTVTNLSQEIMPYEIGGHDAYCTTLFSGENMSDYYIEFPGSDALHPFKMDENCFLTSEKYTYPIVSGKMPLPPKVFGLDTVVLENLPTNRVSLANTKNNVKLTVEFEQFPYLGIWTKTSEFNTNYICIEPWTTLPECTFVGSDLKSKKGIRLLKPFSSESLSYSVIVE